MSEKTNKNFFTAGELANIYGISKQALLYYDKVKLLSPQIVAENGYRHYFIQQYLDLELIVNLRSLDFSIAEIKDYLENRSKEKFIEILKKRRTDCQNLIKDNQKISDVITNILDEEENGNRTPIGKITLTYNKEELLRITTLVEEDSSWNRIVKFAKHTQFNFHNNHMTKKRCGLILSQDDFNSDDKYYAAKAFFSFAPNTPLHLKVLKNILPKGFYLELNFQGSYYRNAPLIRQKINDFLESNDLIPVGDVYVLPIDNHWYFKNIEDYTTKLFMQVREK